MSELLKISAASGKAFKNSVMYTNMAAEILGNRIYDEITTNKRVLQFKKDLEGRCLEELLGDKGNRRRKCRHRYPTGHLEGIAEGCEPAGANSSAGAQRRRRLIQRLL